MSNADSVINSKELIYEPYHQSRGEGFSGQLFLAAEVNNPEKKYIIKAGNAHVAACEFMFYKLAAALGLSVAPVRFVVPARRNEFEYPACAVDFIPNAVKLQYSEFIKIEECEILINLSFILGDSDHMDFLMDESGAVYKIDHSDCFCIEGIAEIWLNPQQVMPMIYQMFNPKPCVGYHAEKNVMRGTLKKISNLKIAEFDDDFNHFRYYINELIEQCEMIN